MLGIVIASFFSTGAMPPVPTASAFHLITPAPIPDAANSAQRFPISWQGRDGYIDILLPGAINPGEPLPTTFRIFDEHNQEVPYVLDPTAPSVMQAQAIPTRSELKNETVFEFDLQSPATEIFEIRFDGSAHEFSREVEVERSADRASWFEITNTKISHYNHGDSHLHIDCYHTKTRYARLTIKNHDDAPLAELTPSIMIYQHHFVFWGNHSHHYMIDWSANGSPPHYDIGDRFRHDRQRIDGNGHLELPPPHLSANDEPASTTLQSFVKIGILLGILAVGAISWKMYTNR